MIALVMGLAGLLGVFVGADLVLDGGTFSRNVDSEFRFFAAWYVAAGLFLLRGLRNVESATFEVRLVGAAFFLAACGRLLSLVDLGSPHAFYVALMVIEFLIPLVIIPWQSLVARGAGSGERP
jgi:hypothetical protein